MEGSNWKQLQENPMKSHQPWESPGGGGASSFGDRFRGVCTSTNLTGFCYSLAVSSKWGENADRGQAEWIQEELKFYSYFRYLLCL